MDLASKYDKRGVSSSKSDVHKAIKHLDKGLFPNAFCKILPDYLCGDEKWCNIMHADTAGTKTALAYMYWKETGDMSVWSGIVQDSIVMNIDDMACVGAVNNIIISSTIGRNKNLISGEVVKALIDGTQDFIKRMSVLGVEIHLSGGETADVGDIVRTLDVGFTAFARIKKEDVIDVQIEDGDVIVGLASYGQSAYEQEYNGGMGSNGLTSARHDMFSKTLATKYPESFDPSISDDLIYTGTRELTDTEPITGLTYGKLVLSPTRTYIPVIKKLVDALGPEIHGLIHCTGGAQTKVLNFVDDLHILKDDLFEVPPLFRAIHEESQTDWKEMFQVFNMGHRLEVYVKPQFAEMVIDASREFDIDAKVIGRCELYQGKKLTIKSEYGEFEY
ncbi:MAG TPA: phosphoribosylformylglycinamidine cyclo-ligase [Flavobacteriales bacterium]|nr:phosphoribosylformylglycinamidine cyclo-ligase [Flavobacteriales bacterium]HIN38976.1 phosphoribosylformylglycinamidine cyclo-ligase [Flavobacteriales bacterium]